MANTKGRVNIPRNPDALLKTAGKVYNKHVADGTKSELNNMDETRFDWVKQAQPFPFARPCTIRQKSLRAKWNKPTGKGMLYYRLLTATLKAAAIT